MTDLHCHILPGMDDGAKDTAVSLELLRREYEDGVRNIAFTSHFNSERTTVDAFTAKRQAAFEQLTAALEGQPMQFDFKLGAEVFFSPGLCELDTRALFPRLSRAERFRFRVLRAFLRSDTAEQPEPPCPLRRPAEPLRAV